VWEYQEEVQEWLYEAWDAEQQRYGVEFQEAIAWMKQLVALAQQRMESIRRTIEEIEATERGIQESEIAIQGMQQPELFGRYQRAINRELYAALDRLEAMQERKHGGSMGSFGQKVTALPVR
jgi:type I site-specific restriction endonuclease